MSITPNFVPREYKTVNLILIVEDVNRALKFYNNAFAAEVMMELVYPNGEMFHAEMKIEDTIIMLTEANYTAPARGVRFKLYTGDVEAMFDSAVLAGAEVVKPIKEEFYGERLGVIKDPFGYEWLITTHMEDFTFSQIKKKFDELNS